MKDKLEVRRKEQRNYASSLSRNHHRATYFSRH